MTDLVSNLATLEKEVDNLKSKEAIRDLVMLYCHLAVAADADGLMGLFAAGGTFGMPATMGVGTVSGEPLRRLIVDSIADKRPWPFLHNHYIRLEGPERATGVVHAEIRLGCQGYKLTHFYVYDDLYVRESGIWKFKHRAVTAYDVTG
jgi:hypothetical protein